MRIGINHSNTTGIDSLDPERQRTRALLREVEVERRAGVAA